MSVKDRPRAEPLAAYAAVRGIAGDVAPATPETCLRMSRQMDYFEALRGDGWVPDPGDRVEVVAEHQRHCTAFLGSGGRCSCAPTLVLRPSRSSDAARERRMFPAAAPTVEAARAS